MQLDFLTGDAPTSSSSCRLCGGARWHIYAKDDQGRVCVVV